MASTVKARGYPIFTTPKRQPRPKPTASAPHLLYAVKPYKHRFFAVYHDSLLTVVTVYRKGAENVALLLNTLATAAHGTEKPEGGDAHA